MGETVEACEPLPKAWRAAVTRLATETRATFLRHAWALRSFTGMRVGPNALRHIEQSLQAVAGLELRMAERLELLSIVDDYVFGHCVSEARRLSQPPFDRKATKALNETMRRSLDEGDFPHLRAMIGRGDPVEVFAKNAGFTSEHAQFTVGLNALLDGLAKRFKLK